MQLISEGFLSSLGTRFLTRLYRRMVRSPCAFVIVAEGGGRTVGFIAGTIDLAHLYRQFLWRDGIPAAALAATHLIAAPRQVLETLRHGASSPKEIETELLAVAVEPTWRGRGVGKLLVSSFLEEVIRQGKAVAHVVLAADNSAARAMYERAGFVAHAPFQLHAGRDSLVMQWEHQPQAHTGAEAGE